MTHESLHIPSPIQVFEYPLFKEKELKVWVKRDDQIHPTISGNKWRKLTLNVEKFKGGGFHALLTFGGAYSNHILATSAVGKLFGIPTVGIIRGEELNAESNETLRNAAANGMKLIFVSREEYSWRYEKDYHYQLRQRFHQPLIIEEGGANYLGVMGCVQCVQEIDLEPDHYVLASGTGTTTAGILLGTNAQVESVPVLKNGEFLKKEIEERLFYCGLDDDTMVEKVEEQLTLHTDYHFGGYGKSTETLYSFMNEFYQESGIPTDHIYTAKAFYGFMDLVKKDYFPKGKKIVVIHTGGLQGNRSLPSGTLRYS